MSACDGESALTHSRGTCSFSIEVQVGVQMQCIGGTWGVWRLGSLWRSLIHWISILRVRCFVIPTAQGQDLFRKRKIGLHRSKIFKQYITCGRLPASMKCTPLVDCASCTYGYVMRCGWQIKPGTDIHMRLREFWLLFLCNPPAPISLIYFHIFVVESLAQDKPIIYGCGRKLRMY